MRTGPGGDFVDARDRMVDTVACGTGRDRVRNDRIDLISASCDLSSNRINYRSLTAEFGCTAQPDGSVFCPEAGARVKVDAGDLDDQILGNLGVVGGAGRDTLVGNDEGSSSRAWTVAM